MADGVALEQGEFVAALADEDEQRAQRDGQVEPGREVAGVGDDDAGGDAQHEAGRADEDVHQDDVLEPEAVGNLDHQVGQGDDAEAPVEPEGGRQAEDDKQEAGDEGEARAELARSQRAVALDRVQAVGLDVGQVVHQVDGAGQQGEQEKGGGGPQQE